MHCRILYSMSVMAQLNLKNISKTYDQDVIAVKDFNLHVEDKEFVVLVGPSGCGKTTSLRMIAGLEDITSGELYIDDVLVNDIPPKDRDIAMVFQNYALYPHMSVYDNMAFGLKIRKFSKPEIEKRVQNAAKILELGDLLQRKPKQLSGGQRQRVAVGRAIVRQPKVFLFDEPLSNLDAKLRVQMRAEISSLHTRLQATMIYVTHDQVEAMTMGDKIVVMKDAKVQQIGSPLDLYNNPANKFVAGFIGSPPMNFLLLNVKQDGKAVYLEGKDGVRIALSKRNAKKAAAYVDKKIFFGIRPERFFDAEDVKSATHIDATIEIVEPLGAETHLYVSVGGQQLIARVEPNDRYQPKHKIKLAYDNEHVSLFDVRSEVAI